MAACIASECSALAFRTAVSSSSDRYRVRPFGSVSMSRDGLIPPVFAKVHSRFRTPYKSNLIIFLLTGLFAAFVPGDVVGDMTSIGTLFAFILVCAGVWILRRKQPGLKREFKTPLVPIVPLLGMLVCGAMIFGLGWTNWLRLAVWLAIGLIIYFAYSARNSKLRGEARKTL